MRSNNLMFLFLLLISVNIFPQKFPIVVHPYREFDFTSVGYTQNGNRVYLATVPDGHIYELNLLSPTRLIDRFRLHQEDKVGECAGSLIYIEDRDQLVVGTTWGRNIYLFNNVDEKINQTEILPDERINIPWYEEISYLLYPQRSGNYIYWGCYHGKSGDPAKIVEFNLTNHKVKVIHFPLVKANYTYATELIDDILFIGTETGKILKFDTRKRKVMDEVIDLKVNSLVFSMSTDGKNLYAMIKSLPDPMFKIENPTEENYRLIRISGNYSYSRMVPFDGYLYLDSRKYNIEENRIEYVKRTYQPYKMFGKVKIGNQQLILGVTPGGYESTDEIGIKEFRIINPRDETTGRIVVRDVKSSSVGAKLQSLAPGPDGKLYLSTYWIGFMYSFQKPDILTVLTDNGKLVHAQADVILPFKEYMLFGCYGGEFPAKLRILNTTQNSWRTLELSIPEEINRIHSRITSLAVDETTDRIFIGSGEKALNKMTPDAVLAEMRLHSEEEISHLKPIKYNAQTLHNPIRFVALAYSAPFLYGISYNRKKEVTFFQMSVVNPDSIQIREMGEIHRKWSWKLRPNTILPDGEKLLVGLGHQLFMYNLNAFNINSPVTTLNFEGEDNLIVSILKDERYYYICFDKRFEVYNKELELVKKVQLPNQKDEIVSLAKLDEYIYAITKLGLLYRFEKQF